MFRKKLALWVRNTCTIAGTAILLAMGTGSAAAQDDVGAEESKVKVGAGGAAVKKDIGDQATNPVANLISLRMQDQYTASSYNADSYANTALLQVVLPVELPFESAPMLVTRTTVPWVWTQDFDDPIGRRKGMGDTTFNAFIIPKWQPKNAVIGVGPTFTLPTAGDNEFTGAGKWQAGPSIVYMNTAIPKWQIGALLFHQWDVGSARTGSQDVSQTYFQPIITKHMDNGWYVAAPDVPQVYNHETNNWSLNLGAVIGRVFKPKNAKNPVQIYGGLYYNTEDIEGVVSPEWTIKFQYGILLPGG